jgi:2-hydroxy-6-oxonona-2,4-dienedioate hydrolase
MHARLGGWDERADTVVLVHGLGVSSRYMLPTLRALEPHVRVAAPDLPGSGRSDTPPDALDIPQLADALVAWMDAMHIGSATLVGNSLGCQIIVDAALRYPTRVERAVLVGPTPDPAIRRVATGLWRLAVDAFREAPSQPFIVAYDYLRFGPRRLWRTFHYAIEDPIDGKLARVTRPTLVVRGSRDPIATGPWVESIVRRMPDAELIVVPGAAHSVNYMAPYALADCVLSFIMNTRDAAR